MRFICNGQNPSRLAIACWLPCGTSRTKRTRSACNTPSAKVTTTWSAMNVVFGVMT